MTCAFHSDENSRSPQSDGLDREAGLLASAEVSDVSSEGGQVEAPLAVTVASTGEDAEADSCGYEGDVGESTKLPPSLRRPADVVVVAPSGQVSSKVTIGQSNIIQELYQSTRVFKTNHGVQNTRILPGSFYLPDLHACISFLISLRYSLQLEQTPSTFLSQVTPFNAYCALMLSDGHHRTAEEVMRLTMRAQGSRSTNPSYIISRLASLLMRWRGKTCLSSVVLTLSVDWVGQVKTSPIALGKLSTR